MEEKQKKKRVLVPPITPSECEEDMQQEAPETSQRSKSRKDQKKKKESQAVTQAAAYDVILSQHLESSRKKNLEVMVRCLLIISIWFGHNLGTFKDLITLQVPRKRTCDTIRDSDDTDSDDCVVAASDVKRAKAEAHSWREKFLTERAKNEQLREELDSFREVIDRRFLSSKKNRCA